MGFLESSFGCGASDEMGSTATAINGVSQRFNLAAAGIDVL